MTCPNLRYVNRRRLLLAASMILGALGATGEAHAARTSSVRAALPRAVDESSRFERRVIGTSVEGRDIEAFRLGTRGGTRVMVVGVIHGDEDAGLLITDVLKSMDPPVGVELWVIPTVNPDGTNAQTRGNANKVDLNRNFPKNWARQGVPGYWQYAGPRAASEPETRAIVQFIRDVRPALGIWYHQDLNMISPGAGFEGRVRARYARLTSLPLVRITGGTYTGVAATWQRSAVSDGLAFVVELGPTLSADQAQVHADAVMAVARMVHNARVSAS